MMCSGGLGEAQAHRNEQAAAEQAGPTLEEP